MGQERVPAYLLMYLFGHEALSEKAFKLRWVDKRHQFRIPCTDHLVNRFELARHVLAAALWEARETGLISLTLHRRERRFFGPKKELTVAAGKPPADPDEWEALMWEAVTHDRPTPAWLAMVLDKPHIDDIAVRGFTMIRLQKTARERGFLREGPTAVEIGQDTVADPDVDCEAVAAVADQGRRFVQRWTAFAQTEPDVLDRLLHAAWDGTRDTTTDYG